MYTRVVRIKKKIYITASGPLKKRKKLKREYKKKQAWFNSPFSYAYSNLKKKKEKMGEKGEKISPPKSYKSEAGDAELIKET